MKLPWPDTPLFDNFERVKVAQFWFVATSVNFHVSEAIAEGPVEVVLEQLKQMKQTMVRRTNFFIMPYPSSLPPAARSIYQIAINRAWRVRLECVGMTFSFPFLLEWLSNL